MAPIRTWAALAAITLASTVKAWHVELPPCVDPFQPFLYTGCFANLDGKSLNYRSSTSSKDMTTEKCVAECKGMSRRSSPVYRLRRLADVSTQATAIATRGSSMVVSATAATLSRARSSTAQSAPSSATATPTSTAAVTRASPSTRTPPSPPPATLRLRTMSTRAAGPEAHPPAAPSRGRKISSTPPR